MAERHSWIKRFFKSDSEEDGINIFNRKLNNDLLINKDSQEVFNAAELHKTLKLINKFGISRRTVEKSKKNNLVLRQKLGIADLEYLVLAMFLIASKKSFNVYSIQKFVKGNNIQTALYDVLFNLYHKKLLNVFPEDADVKFICSSEVLAFFNTGEFKPNMEMSLRQIIRNIDIIANLFNGVSPSSEIAKKHIIKLLYENRSFNFCQELLNVYEKEKFLISCTKTYEFLFYIIGHLIYNTKNCQIHKNSRFINMWCSHERNREKVINEIFNNDDNFLFKNKIFDRAIDESGKADKDKIEIHAEFKRKCLQGILVQKRLDDIIKNNKIIKRSMFYNTDNQKQIDDLLNILKKAQFSKVRNRLKKAGMRTGFAILFSGYAGTGKTETVFQIARQTGRDIMKVDLSSVRSKWWGEDEKNIKVIFSNYKMALQETKTEPILLLNEADAIIGKRLDVTGNNGAIITSINAVQNIILEELENFEGILVATTNLTQNFDSAFERRFLYKIEFEKPNKEVKEKLWENMLTLNEHDSKILAEKYDYTGAQIENIYRKREVKNILYGDYQNLEHIIEICEKENLKEKTKPIGFK